MRKENEQMSFLPVLAASAQLERTFTIVTKRDENGNVKMERVKALNFKDVAAKNRLDTKIDKARIKALQLEGCDALKRKLVDVAQRAAVDARFTGGSYVVRENKAGQVSVALTFKSVDRTNISFDDMAEAWFPVSAFPDMTHDEKVAQVRKHYEASIEERKEQMKNTIDVSEGSGNGNGDGGEQKPEEKIEPKPETKPEAQPTKTDTKPPVIPQQRGKNGGKH